MKATFAYAMPKILVHEGGKVNHPEDPGGRTNQGVTQRVYDGYRRNLKLPLRTVYDMSNTERDEIYKKQYWDAVKGDRLPQGVDYVLFDGAVNSGPAQSIKWLQRALGGVKVDGVLGEATLGALEGVNDHDALIAKIIARREAFLRALKTFKTFGKGWMSRIAQVLKIGQAWARGSVGPEPVYFKDMERKATLQDAKPKATKGAADASTGAGLTTGTLAGAIEAAKETLQPLAGDSAIISYVMTALVITSVLGVAAGLVVRYRAKRHDEKLADALDLEVPA
jgi:lysozyme family protein